MLARHEDGADGAQLLLRDVGESADVLPGRSRVQVGRLGNEAVAFRQQHHLRGPGGEGPAYVNVTVVWRRGDVVAQLSIQDQPAFAGPGRSQPSAPIDMRAVEELARAIDARLGRALR